MLILVAVTINIALNGGLFGKAGTATKGTQKAIEEETLMAAIASAYDEQTGIISKTKLGYDLSNTWTVIGEEEGPYTVTSPKGNAFLVTKNGEIIEKPWVDNGDGTYTKDNKTVSKEKPLSSEEIHQLLGETGVPEGKYNGEWEVLGVEDGKLKLVSKSSLENNVTLGRTDSRATNENVTDHLEKNASEYDIAVWSYAHAVQTLNQAAKDGTGINSARSVTIEDIYGIIGKDFLTKINGDYGKVYRYYYDTTNRKVYYKNKASVDSEYPENGIDTTYATQTFVKYPDKIKEDSVGEVITINSDNQSKDIELTYDYFSYRLTDEHKKAVGSLASGSYWLASPCVNCNGSNVCFYIRTVGGSYINASHGLFYSRSGSWAPDTLGVRAVIYV